MKVRLFAAIFFIVASMMLVGCSATTAENFKVKLSSSSEFGLLDKQPTLELEIKLIDTSNQSLLVALQKKSGSDWLDVEVEEVRVEESLLKFFELDEKAAGKFEYRVSLKNPSDKIEYSASKSTKIQIDDIRLLTRDLFYEDQQKCGAGSRESICITSKFQSNYPGLIQESEYRQRLSRYALSASVPEIDTLLPDPGWTLSKQSDSPKFLLDISKPLPGETYTVTVLRTLNNEKRTIHVTYLKGKLYKYEW